AIGRRAEVKKSSSNHSSSTCGPDFSIASNCSNGIVLSKTACVASPVESMQRLLFAVRTELLFAVRTIRAMRWRCLAGRDFLLLLLFAVTTELLFAVRAELLFAVRTDVKGAWQLLK